MTVLIAVNCGRSAGDVLQANLGQNGRVILCLLALREPFAAFDDGLCLSRSETVLDLLQLALFASTLALR